MSGLAGLPQPSLANRCLTRAAQAPFIITSNAVTGYFAGSVFSIINPIGGAIFGATNALTCIVADVAMDAIGCNRINNTAFQIAKFVIGHVLAAIAATFAVAAAGFPITFAAAATLMGGMILISMAIHAIVACCLCSTGLAAVGVGAALGATAMHTAGNTGHRV